VVNCFGSERPFEEKQRVKMEALLTQVPLTALHSGGM
jgi:hypothetical protein